MPGRTAHTGSGFSTGCYIDRRGEANDPALAESLTAATALFFTGGNQLRVTHLLGGTLADDCLHQRHGADLVLAGTSAGAAMMPPIMITEGPSPSNPASRIVEKRPGLAFAPDSVIAGTSPSAGG